MNNIFLYNPFTKKIKTIEEVKQMENKVPNLADEMRQLAKVKVEKDPIEKKIKIIIERIRIAARYFRTDIVILMNEYSENEIYEIAKRFESLGFNVKYEKFKSSGNKWITIEWK